MNLWAVIPSGFRPFMLRNLVDQLLLDGVKVVVVNTGYEMWSHISPDVTLVEPRNDEKNISAWWNDGLNYVHDQQGDDDTYVVAVLNDDLVLPERFVSRLATTLSQVEGAVAIFPDQHDYLYGTNAVVVHRNPGPVDLRLRLCGFAFALKGSANIRADETLKWWYGDDDIDWTARQRGGSVLAGGLKVEHLCPNQTTIGQLYEQAGRDRQTFLSKWGMTPW